MFVAKIRRTGLVLLILSAVGACAGIIGHRMQAADPPKARKVAAKHDAATTDLDRLQGVWSVVSIEHDGKPSKLDEGVLMVDGKRACWQSRDGEMQGGLYLEPTSKPKSYDLAMSTRTIEGIYSLEGDTLRLCYSWEPEAKRPGGFLTKKGTQQVLVVLKRIHGREVFPYRLPDGTRAFPNLIEPDGTMASPTLFERAKPEHAPPNRGGYNESHAPPPLIAPQPKANKSN